jgi:hypothetical protein
MVQMSAARLPARRHLRSPEHLRLTDGTTDSSSGTMACRPDSLFS